MRNKNIDIFRALSLFLIIIYHSFVLTGSRPFAIPGMTLMISLGGEIGVTAFFALSGYGIYCSLKSMHDKGTYSYFSFLKKRAIRIIPQYYFSIFMCVFVFEGAVYLSSENFNAILTHLLFIHNWFKNYHGAINGVLWTMGVIVQFYLIAPVLFRCFRKNAWVTSIVSIAFTICCKYYVFAYYLPAKGWSGSLEFIAGRQIITALDNFTIGMLIAYLVYEKKVQMKNVISYILFIVSCVSVAVVSKLGMMKGIHTNNVSGYIWHSAIAVCIGLVMFAVSYMKIPQKNFVYSGLLYISKYEYGIYIWHLLIINTLINRSQWIQIIIASNHCKYVFVIFMAISVFMGILLSKMVDTFVASWRK